MRAIESSPSRRGEKLRGILHRALEEHGLARRLPRRVLPEVWEAAVGRQIAARAQPTSLCGGTLHVLVQDHRWRDQLDAARLMLMERLNQRLGAGTVRELQFGLAHSGALDEGRRRAGLGSFDAPQKEHAAEQAAMTAQREAAQQAAAIEPLRVLGESRLEPVLREAVLRAAESASRRAARV